MNLFNNMVTLDMQEALDAAKEVVITNLQYIVDNIAIPIICVILAGILVFAIAKCVKLHKQQQDYSESIIAIVVVVIVIVVVASAPNWLWNIGV